MNLILFSLQNAVQAADIWDNGNFKSIIAVAMIAMLGFLLFAAYRKNDKELMEKLCSRILPIIGIIIAFYFATGG